MSPLFRKCGNLNISQPYGPSWPLTGIALFFYFKRVEEEAGIVQSV
jgi:hypothetical protein